MEYPGYRGRPASDRRRWLKCNFPIFLDIVVAVYLLLTATMLSEWALRSQYEAYQVEARASQQPSPLDPPSVDQVPPLAPVGVEPASPTSGDDDTTSRKLQRVEEVRPRPTFFNGRPSEGRRDASSRAALEHLRQLRARRRMPVEPSNRNVYSAVLDSIGLTFLADIVGIVPDLGIGVALASLTLVALHTAALGDPGEVPDEYEAPDWAETPAKLAKRHQEQQPPAVSNGEHGGDATDASLPSVTCSATLRRGAQMDDVRGSARRHAASLTQHDPFYCRECKHERPLRAHHCKYCGICVVRFDHHCDWIDNCVGVRNHKCFILFIFYISVCILHFLCMTARYFQSRTMVSHVDAWSVLQIVWLVTYLMVVLPCAFLAAFFMCSSVYQLLRDETTIEASFPGRHGKTRGLAGSTVMSRLRSVLGPSVFWWWFPDLQPNGLQLPQPSLTGAKSSQEAAEVLGGPRLA